MDKTFPFNKSRKSNAECWKDHKQKKNLNDAYFGKKERIRLNAYGAKLKENQSDAEKSNQREKERLRIQKYRLKKKQKYMSDHSFEPPSPPATPSL